MINLGTISNVAEKQIVGYLAIDVEAGELAYFTENEMLDSVLEHVIKPKLSRVLLERHDSAIIEHEIEVTSNDGCYLSTLSYALPFPWRITEARVAKGDLYEVLEGIYASMYQEEGDVHE